MKRLFIILSAALLLISCTTDYEETNIKVINLQVNSNDWVENTDSEGLNRYYSASFNMPEITNTVYDWGNVNAYITFDQAQQVLPYVRHFENNEGVMWTRTVDYEYLPGKLNIYVTNSDFFKTQPETMTFRVVLIW
jgi:hypothetical protein